MSVNIQEWHQRYDSFEAQVKEFNKKIKKSALSKEEVDHIYTIVKREVNRLSELTEEATRREEELQQKHCCSCIPSRAAMWTFTGLNFTAKVCSTVGACLAFFYDNMVARWTGIGFYIVGETIDGITTVCQTKLSLESDEASQLAKLNKEGVEHAKIFKKFLKRLKKINRIEAQLLEEYRSREKPPLSDHIVININSPKDLDVRISACLKDYEELPPCYRKEDVYCRMISHLIQKLPPDDPLRIGLDELEPLTLHEDINLLAEHSLPVRYLPNSFKKKFDSSEEKSDKSKWNGEEHSHLKTMDDSKGTVLEYEQQIAYYKSQVMHRFNLKHNISFFETPNGWKVSPVEGARKITDSVEEEDSLKPIHIKKTEKKEKKSTTSKSQQSVEEMV